MNDRIFIFIDGSNIEIAVRNNFNRRVLPEPLARKLTGERKIMGVNYYESPLLPDVDEKSYNEQQKFFDRLRKNPHFNVRLGRRVRREREYECPECRHKFKKTTYEQKGVDSLIALDLITLATRNAYDVAILVGGDQDFIHPIREIRMMGKQVENAFVEQGWSSVLKDVVDKTILLDEEFLKGCWQKWK